MNLLSVIVEGNVEELKSIIHKNIESLINEGIEIKEDVSYFQAMCFLKYDVKIESIKSYSINDFIVVFKRCLAEALSEYIQSCEELNIIHRIINYEYYYFSIEEKVEIQNKVIDLLGSNEDEKAYKGYFFDDRKSKITQELVEFLENNSQIHVNGFITFRLQEYVLQLIEIVEKAVEDFLVDKEYNEFIKLLKYFVDVQEAKIEEVHIIMEKDSKYKLLDKWSNLINDELFEDIATEITDDDMNYEDLLISSLITIAPNKIFIHRSSLLEDDNILRTIYRIFGERVETCDGCDWCSISSKAKKE